MVLVLGSITASLKMYSAAPSVEHVAPTIFHPEKKEKNTVAERLFLPLIFLGGQSEFAFF